jgi:uncharacterized membrane protein YbaN (DUF454 family)
VESGIRVFWLLTGLAALALGTAGLVLPLLPTTPFLLVAAFAFARSSTRLDNWLREHRSFGPLISNWHRDGSIDRRVKRLAIIVIVITPLITWLLGAPLWVVVCQIICLGAAATFILTRPEPKKGQELP